MRIAEDVTQLIGNTPLVRLNKLDKEVVSHILVKLEYYNPGSSVKDWLGYALIEDAEKQGRVQPGGGNH